MASGFTPPGLDRRRGLSARCRKHASRDFRVDAPSKSLTTRPCSASLLGSGHAATYDPWQGARFLTRDPLVAMTHEPYAYAANNPTNNTDPTGLLCMGSLCTPSVDDVVDTVTSVADKAAPVVRDVAGVVNTGFSLCAASPVKNAVCSGGAAISAGVQAGAGTYMYARGNLSRGELALDYLNVVTSAAGYRLDRGSAALSSAASAVRADRASRIAWSSNVWSGFGRVRTATTLPMAWRAGGLQFGSNLLHAGSVLMSGIGLGGSAGGYLNQADC